MPWDSFYRETQDTIRGGADLNHKGKNGITLLHYWVNAGRLDIVELLLDGKADINLTEDSNWTALHFAAAHGNLELVKLLVSRGADVQALADGTAKPGLLDRLLGRTAKVKLTPCAAARNAGHQAVADYLGGHQATG